MFEKRRLALMGLTSSNENFCGSCSKWTQVVRVYKNTNLKQPKQKSVQFLVCKLVISFTVDWELRNSMKPSVTACDSQATQLSCQICLGQPVLLVSAQCFIPPRQSVHAESHQKAAVSSTFFLVVTSGVPKMWCVNHINPQAVTYCFTNMDWWRMETSMKLLFTVLVCGVCFTGNLQFYAILQSKFYT